MTDDFFRSRLAQMIDLRQPQAILANRMPWQEIEVSLTQRWARQAKAVWKIKHLDLFGFVAGVVPDDISYGARPRLPVLADGGPAVAMAFEKPSGYFDSLHGVIVDDRTVHGEVVLQCQYQLIAWLRRISKPVSTEMSRFAADLQDPGRYPFAD
jgi:hypothetical protein